jgi:hypothetical protein
VEEACLRGALEHASHARRRGRRQAALWILMRGAVAAAQFPSQLRAGLVHGDVLIRRCRRGGRSDHLRVCVWRRASQERRWRRWPHLIPTRGARAEFLRQSREVQRGLIRRPGFVNEYSCIVGTTAASACTSMAVVDSRAVCCLWRRLWRLIGPPAPSGLLLLLLTALPRALTRAAG